MEHDHSVSRAPVLRRDFARAVGRAVVDEHKSIRCPRLAGHRLEELKKAPFLIEEWDDYGEEK
jgi:hypothetical protein